MMIINAADIEITVYDELRNKNELPTKYNTYFDRGVLKGIQSYLKVQYTIHIRCEEEIDLKKEGE